MSPASNGLVRFGLDGFQRTLAQLVQDQLLGTVTCVLITALVAWRAYKRWDHDFWPKLQLVLTPSALTWVQWVLGWRPPEESIGFDDGLRLLIMGWVALLAVGWLRKLHRR